MITAPFNFVPLSEKVFFPDWAEEVSHDVPFEDAQSGMIDITITAKSPIFIRDHDKPEEFCNHNGEYYIPGSSVKGMVRNVLEIMSFSKMTQIDDDTYAVRDLSKADNFYMSQMREDVYCGWLIKRDSKYYIEDCGVPGRISHREIDKATGKNFASKFRQNGFEKTSEYKYNILGKTHQTVTVGDLYKSVSNAKYDKRLFCKYKENGKKGTLVVTGQPTVRKDTGKMGDGKGFEFVFFESNGEIELLEKTYKNFLFAYFNDRKTEPKESPDWKYWKAKMDKGEKVPVFFQKNGKDVAHFGLSYLYKLPYTHSVKDGLPPAHSDNRKDLAETMFGYIEQDEALKGRVQFSHCKAVQNAVELKKRTEILGTPRASYYPIYVKQYSTDFKTFMHGDFAISGWKRYPVHQGAGVVKTTDTGNENVGTTFSPLKDGVVFSGKLRFHNLRKSELGALLSALTFHNTQECFHNIGMAKSLGYGKIKLKLEGIENIEEYLKAFEVEVAETVENWVESDQIKELFSMASEQNNDGRSELKYMELKQFANSKSKDKDYLRNYTALDNIVPVIAKSLIDERDIDELRKRQEERKEKEKLLQEKRKREEQHKKEWEIVYNSEELSTIENFIRKFPESPYLETAKKKAAEIKAALIDEENIKREKAAQEKWNAVQNVEQKYKQKALEDFIVNYGYSSLVEEAKKELETFSGSTKQTNHNLEALSSVQDGKLFKKILDNLDISEADKEIIKEYAIAAYGKLKGKKQKNFFKEAQLGRFIGAELENEVKNEV